MPMNLSQPKNRLREESVVSIRRQDVQEWRARLGRPVTESWRRRHSTALALSLHVTSSQTAFCLDGFGGATINIGFHAFSETTEGRQTALVFGVVNSQAGRRRAGSPR